MRPWGGRLGRIQTATTVAGAALIGLGWWGASGSGNAADQLNWLSVAIGGLVVAALGQAFFLLDAYRRVATCRLAVIRPQPDRGGPAGAITPAGAGRNGAGRLVAVPRGRRYHQPDCHLVTGKSTTVVPPVRLAGLLPCEVCRP